MWACLPDSTFPFPALFFPLVLLPLWLTMTHHGVCYPHCLSSLLEHRADPGTRNSGDFVQGFAHSQGSVWPIQGTQEYSFPERIQAIGKDPGNWPIITYSLFWELLKLPPAPQNKRLPVSLYSLLSIFSLKIFNNVMGGEENVKLAFLA